jgi:acyl carrier protein
MSDDRVLARLVELAVGRFGEAAATLGADDDLFDTLGIDSLQALDLLTDLEEAFDVEIPDYELQGVNTLGGLAEVIRRRR